MNNLVSAKWSTDAQTREIYQSPFRENLMVMPLFSFLQFVFLLAGCEYVEHLSKAQHMPFRQMLNNIQPILTIFIAYA